MNIEKIKKIADDADMIINGYAFKKTEAGCSVINLKIPESAAVFDEENEMIETSMDEIELSIARDYLVKNKHFMED